MLQRAGTHLRPREGIAGDEGRVRLRARSAEVHGGPHEAGRAVQRDLRRVQRLHAEEQAPRGKAPALARAGLRHGRAAPRPPRRDHDDPEEHEHGLPPDLRDRAHLQLVLRQFPDRRHGSGGKAAQVSAENRGARMTPSREETMKSLFRGLLFLALLGALPCANSQDWPNRPVRWILSQPAGASPDITARLVADRLSTMWGQQVIVDNRPGGQNVIGAQLAAKSPADGHNDSWATTASPVSNPFTFKSRPHDPERDFAPVALIGKSPMVVAVNNSVPASSPPRTKARRPSAG